MRIFKLMYLIVYLSCAGNDVSNHSKYLGNEIKSDTILLENILSINGFINEQILVSKDSIFELLRYSKESNNTFTLNKWCFSSEKKSFISCFTGKINNEEWVELLKRKNKEKVLHFESLNDPNIEYDRLPMDSSKIYFQQHEIVGKVRGIKFGKRYYFTSFEETGSFYVYNLEDKSFEVLKLGRYYYEIKFFFLFDLDGDNIPEIIFFHQNDIPHDSVITMEVFKIGKS
jgi:hypothetical protein